MQKTKSRELQVFTTALFLTTLFLASCTSTLTAINTGPIQQDPSSLTLGTWVDDQTIETVAGVNIRKADPALANSHITVVSHHGIVLLVGQVGSESLKELAGNIARKVHKVRRVYNELGVTGPTTMLVRSGDGWITAKIKARMVAEKDFPSNSIKVVTENGTVYLMGRVTPEQATTAVNIVKQSYGVQKIVKIFEYLRTTPINPPLRKTATPEALLKNYRGTSDSLWRERIAPKNRPVQDTNRT